MKRSASSRILALALTLCVCLSLLPTTSVLAANDTAKTALGFGTGALQKNTDGTVTLRVAYADERGVHTEDITPTAMTAEEIAVLDYGSDFSKGFQQNTVVELLMGKDGKVASIRKLYDAGIWFDLMKYGGELSPVGGKAGAMLASGWITEKSGGKITVGDLYRFQETYTLADSLQVYEYNTESGAIATRTLSDVPVTQKTDGSFYNTASRQQVIALFDGNYTTAGTAKVAALYYLTPQSAIDAKYLYEPDGMPIDSYMNENGGKTSGKPNGAVWTTATKPFAIIPQRLYYVGDNEVASYLIVADNGDLILLDTGWPTSGYQYWQSIEECGYDPRAIDHVLLTHGHGDHYGTAVELDTMIKNAGGDPVIYETYEDMKGYDIYGYPEIKGIINDPAVLACVDQVYVNDTWMDFGGAGGIEIMPILTPGHTNGTCSFSFKTTVPDTGEALKLAYLGGYGVNGLTTLTEKNGYLRLAFQYGLRWLQQNVEVDYMLPQHTNQYPIVEVNRAAELAGISFMNAQVRGNSDWTNFLEKRQAVIAYDELFQSWKKNPINEDGIKITVSKDDLTPIDVAGPFRREAGTYQITLTDSGKLIQGFDKYQNQSPALAGVKNYLDKSVGDGIVILRDSYTHDPEGYYVQLSVKVSDGYTGACGGGPVEAIHKEWSEIVRTERLGSKAEAEALLATLQKGKTYTVSMDASSEIQLADNPSATFVESTEPAASTGFSDVASSAWYASAVNYVTGKELFSGVSATAFAPDASMTRSMLAAVLFRASAGAGITGNSAFTDVDANAWYYEGVDWAASNGVMNGISTSAFSADAPITREMLVTTLYRYGQFRGDTLSPKGNLAAFTDAAQVSDWATDATAWAVGAGILSGTSTTTLSPQGPATRAQVAAMLQRALDAWEKPVAVKGITALENPVHKVVALVLEYPVSITAPGLTGYTVTDYEPQYYVKENEQSECATGEITAVYTNSTPDLRADRTSIPGKYVIIELKDSTEATYSEADGLWHTNYAGVATCRYSKSYAGHDNSILRTDYSNLVVKQTVDVMGSDGRVAVTAGTLPALKYEALTNRVIDDFQDMDLKSSAGYPIYAKLYVPKNYDASKSYPLVVDASGGSQRLLFNEQGEPINYGANLTRDTGAVGWLNVTKDVIIVTPQLQNKPPYAETYDEYRDTYELIQYLTKTYNVDSKRIYGIGSSYGTLHLSTLISQHPELFAAYVQCNGNFVGATNMYVDAADVPGADYKNESLIKADTEYYPEFKKALQCVVDNEIAIWVCHGANDPTAPVTRGVTTYKMLTRMYQEAGKSPAEIEKLVRMSIYEDEDFLKKGIWMYHEANKMASSDLELMAWIMQQSRD